MIIGTLNIRGGVNALKRRRVNSLINKGQADIFLLQETKISNMNEVWAKSFWSSSEVDFSFSNSMGRSGGFLTIWRKDVVEVLSSFKGEGFLGIHVRWNNH